MTAKDTNTAFDSWYFSSKYAQVVSPSHVTRQPALDGWMAGRDSLLLDCIAELDGMTTNSATARSAIRQCVDALKELK